VFQPRAFSLDCFHSLRLPVNLTLLRRPFLQHYSACLMLRLLITRRRVQFAKIMLTNLKWFKRHFSGGSHLLSLTYWKQKRYAFKQDVKVRWRFANLVGWISPKHGSHISHQNACISCKQNFHTLKFFIYKQDELCPIINYGQWSLWPLHKHIHIVYQKRISIFNLQTLLLQILLCKQFSEQRILHHKIIAQTQIWSQYYWVET